MCLNCGGIEKACDFNNKSKDDCIVSYGKKIDLLR